METTGRTAMQDFAIGLLKSGPLTLGEAMALRGPALVGALRQLTKHKVARVTYSRGAYRLVVR